jgi:hypothetical protein
MSETRRDEDEDSSFSQHTHSQYRILVFSITSSAAVVRFSPVQRGFCKNREPDLGPVLPESTNPEPDPCERFWAVRFGFLGVRMRTEPKKIPSGQKHCTVRFTALYMLVVGGDG